MAHPPFLTSSESHDCKDLGSGEYALSPKGSLEAFQIIVRDVRQADGKEIEILIVHTESESRHSYVDKVVIKFPK